MTDIRHTGKSIAGLAHAHKLRLYNEIWTKYSMGGVPSRESSLTAIFSRRQLPKNSISLLALAGPKAPAGVLLPEQKIPPVSNCAPETSKDIKKPEQGLRKQQVEYPTVPPALAKQSWECSINNRKWPLSANLAHGGDGSGIRQKSLESSYTCERAKELQQRHNVEKQPNQKTGVPSEPCSRVSQPVEQWDTIVICGKLLQMKKSEVQFHFKGGVTKFTTTSLTAIRNKIEVFERSKNGESISRYINPSRNPQIREEMYKANSERDMYLPMVTYLNYILQSFQQTKTSLVDQGANYKMSAQSAFFHTRKSYYAEDTSDSRYLRGHAPDVTIFRLPSKTSTSHSQREPVAIIEMKAKSLGSGAGNASGQKQLKKYLSMIHREHPEREFAVGMLSNGKHNIVMISFLKYPGRQDRISRWSFSSAPPQLVVYETDRLSLEEACCIMFTFMFLGEQQLPRVELEIDIL